MTGKSTVLIVDDDPVWVEELVDILVQANYDVEVARSFEVARDKLRSKTYATIVIDLQLEPSEDPQMYEGFGLLTGIQFLESLSQGQGKAIVLSAYGTLEHREQAFKRGVYKFVSKQRFDRDEFLDIVQGAVELWTSYPVMISKLKLSPEEEKQYERLVREFIREKGVQSLRDLTPEEEREFQRLTREFMRGKPIIFDVPEDAVNPWERETDLAEQDQ